MKILTNDEAAIWCSGRGFILDVPPHWDDGRIRSGIRYATKSKQSVVEAFIRCVVNNLEFDEAIVWLTDWPLYKPDEMAVVQRFRASIGEKRWLIDAPGHVFGPTEIDDCVGFFNLCVQYYWDACLFVPQAKLHVYNSHHEVQYMSSPSEQVVTEVATLIKSFELTPSLSQFRKFTDRARKIVDLASTEANRLGDTSVDTVHLLVGMIREGEGIAGVALAEHGVDANTLLDAHNSVRDEPDVTFAEVEIRSKKEASWFTHRYPGTEHLLLGLCCLKSSRAARLLEQLGKQPVRLCHFVVEILGHGHEWERWLTDHPEMTQD